MRFCALVPIYLLFNTVFMPCLAQADTTASDELMAPPTAGCQVGPVSTNRSFSEVNPNGYCIDGRFYRGASHRIGRINVFGPHGLTDINDGPYAIVTGGVAQDLFGRLADEGPCPEDTQFPKQWRSDWYADEGGYHNRKSQLQSATFLSTQMPARVVSILEYETPPSPRSRSQHLLVRPSRQSK